MLLWRFLGRLLIVGIWWGNLDLDFVIFASLFYFLLLLRRGDRLTRRAVTFFFAKKENHERKLLGGTP